MISFPSIEQFRHVIASVKQHTRHARQEEDRCKEFPILKFIGTVKLHGTNTAIGYEKVSGHWCQSRNNVITPQKNKMCFAETMDPLADQFFNEFVLPQSSAIREHYEQGRKIVIYGEWCGGNIQKGVAIYGLPQMFVIFKVRVCEEVVKTTENTIQSDENVEQISKFSFWLQPKEWSHLKWHEKLIYNIYDFPTYEIDISFESPHLAQNMLVEISEAVEHQCPVGTYFNKKGIGEGVVWCCWEHSSGVLTFKVKGEKHSVSKVTTLARVDVDKLANIREFVDYACTENRMLQGLDYLREQKVPIEIKNVNSFLKWLLSDIIKEEKDTMEASSINSKDIWSELRNKAKPWYQKQLT